MTAAIPATILDVLRDRFGLTGTGISALGGELDLNLAVSLADGTTVVVKVAPPDADVARIRWQHELIRRASGALGDVAVPEPRPALDGDTVALADVDDETRAITVHSYADGRTLSQLTRRSPELLAELGVTAARMVHALADAPAPPDSRSHHWDVLRPQEAVAAGIGSVTDPERVATVDRLVRLAVDAVAEHGGALPRGVVHQDFNDFNVLVRQASDGTHHVTAVLDFADALHTARISELVIAVAYGLLRTADPLTAAAAVVAGYAAEAGLTEAELAVLFPLVAARLCVNAVTWTHRGGADTDYGPVRMRYTWPAIKAVAAIAPELAHAVFRDAAGLPADAVDLPSGSGAVPELPDGVEFGRHLETGVTGLVRRTTATGETATLRLGLTVQAPQPFSVHTPFDATVEQAEPLLLRHDRPEGTVWSRWTGVNTEQTKLAAGERIGRSSSITVAVFRDQATALSAPALVPAGHAAGWAAVSPDPAAFLGLPQARRPEGRWDVDRIVATRDVHFARSQRSYYRRPMNLVAGRGSWLYDDQGRAYLDAINNVSHVGHANPRVVAAAAGQLGRLNTNSRFVYPGIAQYAERLTSLLPEGLEVTFLVCSGSEANDLAVRMARQVTGRQHMLVVDGAYHGNSGVMTGLSPNRYKGPGGTGPAPTTHEVEQPNPYRGRYGYTDPGAGTAYAADVRDQVGKLVTDGTPPAAFLAESAMGTAGSIFYPDGYLAEAYAAVRAAGGLCIADEVQVGFGRFGDVFWGFQSQGVVPDIVTMGKPIGNGHPMAAVVTTREIADAFDSGMRYFNTFGGNPVSCAIGTAVLDEIEELGLRQHAAETGAHFRAVLEDVAGRHDLIGDVRSHGMYLGVELVRDRDTKEPAKAEALVLSELMKDEGVIVYPTGTYDNVLKLKPPLMFTKSDADLFGAVLDDVLTRDW
jgi:4-aminobutyrate aminotransferase-like enzyme/Ser/Thr protein kinase RdoA (MazF antagonist)